ncbi:GNAT family N-acetyltransferase [Acinetobacter nectaris]|uniref:GNAT family N-acetyltransferase n=1 Tax=Acinetobacter nectaris TaxID=1219382 RepID=UPI001F2B16E0|nr:GNAT family N-acetyltransferase [Acinetobacter nectaris]MCF9045665.1 acetyl-CoA sensor PanZ family protein [Acinetobacter nectaris]
MPITIHAYSSLENKEIEAQLERLYMTSPEFMSGLDAVEQLKEAIGDQTLLYTAEFNTKIIAAIWCFRNIESAKVESKLQYIVVHPSNRGRGIAQRLILEVCRMERLDNKTTIFIPGCGAIHKILQRLD